MNVTLFGKKGTGWGAAVFADVIKDLEMKRLSWIIQADPTYKHIYSYKREAEGDSNTDRREDSVTAEAETGVMWPQAKERQQPPDAGRSKEPTLP